MRVIFMGAPDFAVPALEALIDLGAEIVAVYTRAPRPAGRRGLAVTKTAVHLRAEAAGLEVRTPASLRGEEAAEAFRALRPDVAIVAAYGLILPPAILAIPPLGCLNLHGSLLPRWRGAAPIQRAIMAGDAETGVGLMRMEAGLDTGPVAYELRTPILPEHTAGDLTQIVSRLGGQALRDCWSRIQSGSLDFRPQPEEGVVYARKIEKAETPIDWTGSATEVRNHIHGLSPFPGAYSESARDERIKFLRVEAVEAHGEPGRILDEDLTIACGSAAIRARLVQRAGKGPVSGSDLLRGQALKVGEFIRLPAGIPTEPPAGA